MECSYSYNYSDNNSSSVCISVVAAAASVIVIIIVLVLVVIVVAVNLSCSLHHRQHRHHFNCSRYDYCSFSVYIRFDCVYFFSTVFYWHYLYVRTPYKHSINQFCPILEFMICSIQLNFISIFRIILFVNPANHCAPVIEIETERCVLFERVSKVHMLAHTERRTKCWIHDGKTEIYLFIVL